MNWIDDYLDRAVYVDGGRGPVAYDCWGLVREARAKHMGFAELPLYARLRNDNPRGFTRAYLKECAHLRECAPEHGAIAAVMVGKICNHVAVVIEDCGELWILEINPDKSARKLRLGLWMNDHLRVTFHND